MLRSGRGLEDALDQRSAELIALRKAAVQQAAAAPAGSAAAAPLQSALGRWGEGSSGLRWGEDSALVAAPFPFRLPSAAAFSRAYSRGHGGVLRRTTAAADCECRPAPPSDRGASSHLRHRYRCTLHFANRRGDRELRVTVFGSLFCKFLFLPRAGLLAFTSRQPPSVSGNLAQYGRPRQQESTCACTGTAATKMGRPSDRAQQAAARTSSRAAAARAPSAAAPRRRTAILTARQSSSPCPAPPPPPACRHEPWQAQSSLATCVVAHEAGLPARRAIALRGSREIPCRIPPPLHRAQVSCGHHKVSHGTVL